MNPFKRQIYKFGLLEANEKNPPTISDNTEEYTSGVFTFNNSHFTKDFEDLDGDGFKLTKIDSLPIVGNLNYDGNPVEEGFTFNLNNVNNLTYELPDNYMITSQGYCEFNKSLEEIISEQEVDGFELTYLGEGRIEFKKESSSAIPNNTDIYAFFDATSMNIEDAESANLALTEWFNGFKENNILYEGNLYILPIVQENWVDFPNIIIRGSSNRVRNNSDRPNDDFMEFAILPDNFDRTSSNINPNWTPPTEVVTLAFIDESADGSQAYHKNRNGYGLIDQPTSQYLTDFKNFKENYENNFDFFKGVFYPIPDIEYGNYNNIYNAAVLQGFSAIEGKATYTLEEIENLGVTFAGERRFHWHLDPNNNYYTGEDLNIANPYSVEAETSVPNTSYNVQPLKNFGWSGSYDKDQPASEVFSSDTFNSDLNSYLQGDVSTSEEIKIIEGNCTQSENLCFDFKTSDDSDYLLFSNQASFCFTGSHEPENVDSVNAPTVDNVNREIESNNYAFIINDFTNNFHDEDGDSYLETKILSGFKTTKGEVVGSITYETLNISYPFTFNLNNVGDLQFELDSSYIVLNNRLVKYNSGYLTDINDLELNGYYLLYNEGNKLIYNRINTSDPQNPVIEKETIEGKDSGGSNLCLNFRTNDDSDYNLYSNTAKLCLKIENKNTPPSVDGWSDVLSDAEYIFTEQVFTNNFSDEEGENASLVRINPNYIFPEELVLTTIINSSGDEVEVLRPKPDSDKEAWGYLTFDGAKLTEEFSFNLQDISKLKFETPDRFIQQGDKFYSFNKNIQEIEDEQLEDDYILVSNTEGLLTFERTVNSNTEQRYITGNEVSKQEICFEFSTSDDNEIPLFSDTKEVCLIVPSEETPIEFNRPPVVGDKEITLE